MGNQVGTAVPRLNAEIVQDAFDNIDLVLFDCDGTLWCGRDIIPGAAKCLQRLVEMGKQVGYVTNGSVSTRAQTIKSIKTRGFPLCSEDLVATNNHAIAQFLGSRSVESVFTVGNIGLDEELDNAGIEHYTTTDKDPRDEDLDKPVDAVVVSLDEEFNYRRMSHAAHKLLTQPNVKFVATNVDPNYPIEGRIVPGVGPIVAAIEMASGGRRPDVVIGKPSTYMFKQLGTNVDPARVLMVGDRCDADMAFASNIGAWSLLVLTGVSDLKEANEHAASESLSFNQAPSCYLNSIGDMNRLLDEMATTEP